MKPFSHSVGATIGQEPTARSLDSGCGLSHECAHDGCNGTCVKLEKLKVGMAEIFHLFFSLHESVSL